MFLMIPYEITRNQRISRLKIQLVFKCQCRFEPGPRYFNQAVKYYLTILYGFLISTLKQL